MNRKSHVHAHLAAIVAAVYVSTVLSEAMHGKTVQTPVPRPYGCSVKYWQ